jgi:DNA-binding transcriptional ArsR family regulator
MGNAWNGFAELRKSVLSSGSPQESTTLPSDTAAACTRCLASTTSPRQTSTTIGSTAAETNVTCERSGFTVCSAIIDRYPDYDLDDVLVVEDPKQLRALGDVLRARIVMLLRERAASTTELAAVLETPKGTVGHHLKVLEKAGLVRVVRTRKVRALTEKFYGRVARLFVLKGDESMPKELRGGVVAAMMLRQAADELIASGDEQETSALVHVRLTPTKRRRFEQRLNRLVADAQRADDPEGESHAITYALFNAPRPLPPPIDDA